MAASSDDDTDTKPQTNPTTIPDDSDMDNTTNNDGGEENGASSSDPAPDDDDDDEADIMSKTVIGLGGTRGKKSFALLDGVYQDPESGEQERVTIDITRLPALLGRSNESDKDNRHFFGLGKKKALSRKHCTIYYRDREGGRVEWNKEEGDVVYKDTATVAKESDQPVGSKKQPKPNHHLVADDEDDAKDADELPTKGFFVIECLGKNRILVDQTRVEQGESMVLRSGSAIRISSYMLYFLLPQDAESKPHKIEIPLSDEERERSIKKGKKKATKAKGGTESSDKKVPSIKKRPVPTIAPSAMKKQKKGGGNSAAATLAELEVLPVEDLIEKMDAAVSKGLWDRRNQFIGATICYHAVRSAGMAIEIQEKVAAGGGVSRSDIMDWIEKSELYGGWVQQMLTNMEPRSYQAAITKSLLKSGFVRTSGAGRYIKWLIPDDIPMKVKGGKDGDASSSSKKKQKMKTINSVTAAATSSRDGGDASGGEMDESNDGDGEDDDVEKKEDATEGGEEEEEAPSDNDNEDYEMEEEEEEEEESDGNRDEDENEGDGGENDSDNNEKETNDTDEIDIGEEDAAESDTGEENANGSDGERDFGF